MPIISGQAVTAPAGPGATLVATAEPGAAPPRVRLDLVTGDTTLNGVVPVSVLGPDGRTRSVRGGIKLTAGSGTGFHYEAPFDEPVSYLTADAAGTTSNRVVLTGTSAVLVHPFRPTLSMVVEGASRSRPEFDAGTFAERSASSQAVFLEPWGREDDPIVITSGRMSTPSSTLTIRTRTLAQRDAVWRIVADDSPLLLNVPAAMGVGSVHEWVKPTSVQEARRPGADGRDPVRLFTMPYRVVGAPLGDLRAVWTWADVLNEFETWADVLAAYDTWADLETDTRRVM